MGLDWSATAAIGIMLRESDLMEQKIVPGCSHTNNKAAKYCSECGKMAWRAERSPLSGYNQKRMSFLGIPVHLYRTNGEDERERRVIVAPYAVACSSACDEEMVQVPYDAVLMACQKLKAALEPVGLWHESKFGLYAVLDVTT